MTEHPDTGLTGWHVHPDGYAHDDSFSYCLQIGAREITEWSADDLAARVDAARRDAGAAILRLLDTWPDSGSDPVGPLIVALRIALARPAALVVSDPTQPQGCPKCGGQLHRLTEKSNRCDLGHLSGVKP